MNQVWVNQFLYAILAEDKCGEVGVWIKECTEIYVDLALKHDRYWLSAPLILPPAFQGFVGGCEMVPGNDRDNQERMKTLLYEL